MVYLCCLTDCIVEQPQSLNGEQSTSLIASIKQCHSLSKQTIEKCNLTLATGSSLIKCGESIQQSLIGAATDLDAESFSIIADLIDGDKVKEAKGLAETMKVESNEFISLSMQMVTALQQGVDALPNMIENYVENKASEVIDGEISNEERALADVDADLNDLSDCIDAIENLRLITAVKAGTNAFKGITEKTRQCHRVYEIIRKFATSLTTITEAFINMDVSAVMSKVQDILRAIGLSTMIKKFAEGCEKIMSKIIDLFQAAAGKLSLLWKSLVQAKDKIIESLTDVVDARSLCREADEKVDKLKQLAEVIGKKFWDLKNLKPETLTILREMNEDSSIDDAVETTRGIDDGINAAIKRMQLASKRLKDEFDSLPSIITDGLSSIVSEDDTLNDSVNESVKSMGADILELENSFKTIEEENILNATKAIHNESTQMLEKIDHCKEMLQVCTDFTEKSKSSINTFLGKWSLETAESNLKEMSRLVSFSLLMQKVASQIQKLLQALMRFFQVISARVKEVIEKAHQLFSGSGAVEVVLDTASDLVSLGLSNALHMTENLMSDRSKD